MSHVFDDYCTQLSQGVVDPLAQFIDRDLASVAAQKKTYEGAVEGVSCDVDIAILIIVNPFNVPLLGLCSTLFVLIPTYVE